MRRAIFLLVVLVALLLATSAYAEPKVDKVTGTCTFSPGGSVWSFSAFEPWGSPGESGYAPARGWVTTENFWFNGTWRVVDCTVYDDTTFIVSLDVNGSVWTTALGYDRGEPGWRMDGNSAGYVVSSGNLKVHNYPFDGD